MTEVSSVLVVGLGIGTVFVGLISLVFICYLVSFVCKLVDKSMPAPSKSPATAAPAAGGQIANKGEIVAAACAAIAEELGEDVKNIKVVSFRKA